MGEGRCTHVSTRDSGVACDAFSFALCIAYVSYSGDSIRMLRNPADVLMTVRATVLCLLKRHSATAGRQIGIGIISQIPSSACGLTIMVEPWLQVMAAGDTGRNAIGVAKVWQRGLLAHLTTQ